MATIIGCEVGTVESWVSRAQHRLAKALGYGGDVAHDPPALSAMNSGD